MDGHQVEAICPECGRPRAASFSEHHVGSSGGHGEPRRGALFALILALAAISAILILLPEGDEEPFAEAPPTSTAPSAPAPPAADLGAASGTRVAYASAEGLVIVEIESATFDLTDVALTSPAVAYADPFVLVADDRRTLAVHPAVPDEPFVLATNYRLVSTAVPNQYVFVPAASGIDDAGEVFVGQASDGSFGPSIPLPPGSRRLAAPGVGVLVAGPEGATYEVGFSGLERVSDAAVIAAAGPYRVEVRCDTSFTCRTDVVDGVGASAALADEVAGRLGTPTLSADGRWVAGRDGATVVVVEVDSGEVRELEVEGAVIALAWVPGADLLVAMVGPRDTARLAVVPVAADAGSTIGAPTIVDLTALGAPSPLGSDLVAF
ncbi:MAG: hypothetical protein R2707_09855 [Acidimicrobiales bacterium]